MRELILWVMTAWTFACIFTMLVGGVLCFFALAFLAFYIHWTLGALAVFMTVYAGKTLLSK